MTPAYIRELLEHGIATQAEWRQICALAIQHLDALAPGDAGPATPPLAEIDGIFNDLKALLMDERPVHVLHCNFQAGTALIGDKFCNCPLGKRIYRYKRRAEQAEAALAALTPRQETK